jgi:hypothetical protein
MPYIGELTWSLGSKWRPTLAAVYGCIIVLSSAVSARLHEEMCQCRLKIKVLQTLQPISFRNFDFAPGKKVCPEKVRHELHEFSQIELV